VRLIGVLVGIAIPSYKSRKIIKNNKGFSLIEVLVTVGLIGILVSIAVPAYKNYKQGTLKMAMRTEVGSAIKVYGAKYAIDGNYCFNFTTVGLDLNKENSPIFKRNGFYGFGGFSPDAGNVCSLTDLSEVQFISKGSGTCKVNGVINTGLTDQFACEGNSPMGSWTDDTGSTGENAPNCILGSTSFSIGGYTAVNNLRTMIQGNQNNIITETASVTDCQ